MPLLRLLRCGSIPALSASSGGLWTSASQPEMVPGDEAHLGTVASSTAAARNGRRMGLAGEPQRRLVVPMRARRVAAVPGRQHADAAIEVGQVVHGAPRRDHAAGKPCASVERRSASPSVRRRRRRPRAPRTSARGRGSSRADAQSVTRCRSPQRHRAASSPRRSRSSSRAASRAAPSSVAIEVAGAEHLREGAAQERLAPGVVPAEQLLAQGRGQRAPGDVAAPHLVDGCGRGVGRHGRSPRPAAARARPLGRGCRPRRPVRAAAAHVSRAGNDTTSVCRHGHRRHVVVAAAGEHLRDASRSERRVEVGPDQMRVRLRRASGGSRSTRKPRAGFDAPRQLVGRDPPLPPCSEVAGRRRAASRPRCGARGTACAGVADRAARRRHRRRSGRGTASPSSALRGTRRTTSASATSSTSEGRVPWSSPTQARA